MFTPDTLRQIFQSRFDSAAWRDMLTSLFGDKLRLRAASERLDASSETETAYYLGEADIPGAKIGFFQFEIREGSVVNKRVGLRKLVEAYIKQRTGIFDAAFAVFDDGENWRVSFISDIKGEATTPKRYTFLFGDATHGYRTAVERFSKLQSAGISLKTLLDAFSVETLTKDLYKELFSWYQWSLSEDIKVSYPNGKTDEHLIRLVTRLMFVWFIKQKNLVPGEIFDAVNLHGILAQFDPQSETRGNYYNAILQNLFFATLNRPINERGFASAGGDSGNEHYGIKNLFRDNREQSWFKITHDEFLDVFKPVPFLNGGLFECLDKEKETDEKTTVEYIDGFSRDDTSKKRAFVPNCLFFGGGAPRFAAPGVNAAAAPIAHDGLLTILKRYNFTIEENTPNDVTVALDPELLGKVFENLLGAYNNPDASQTVRKEFGSFYTPREIVNYMVDESLIAYLKQAVGEQHEDDYRKLFAGNADVPVNLKSNIYKALLNCKILDPACGSGAFPMGILNRMIDTLKKLDPDLNLYKTKLDLIENCIYGVDIQPVAVQISKLRFFISLVVEQRDSNKNPDVNYGILPLPNLESKFIAANTLTGLDKEHKGQLDLQDAELIAMKQNLWDIRNHKNLRASSWREKAKLRKEDRGFCKKIEACLIAKSTKPDVEKIKRYEGEISANEIAVENLPEVWVDDYEKQMALFEEQPKTLFKKDLNKENRDLHLERVKWLKAEISKEERKSLLKGLEAEIKKMTRWEPYDQNKHSEFFDVEWMFGISGNGTSAGFDIIIGNPPYKRVDKSDVNYLVLKTLFKTSKGGKINLYKSFFEKGIEYLKTNGVLSYITPNTYITSKDSFELRKILMERNIIEIIEYTEKDKVFENVEQAVATIVFVNNKTDTHCIKIKTDKQGSNLLPQNLFYDNDKIMFLPINPVIAKINRCKNKISDFLLFYQGEINLTFKKDFYSKVKKCGALPMWRGDNVGKYFSCSEPDEFCNKEADNRLHWKRERIVVQQVSNQSQSFRTRAFLTPKNYFCGNSTNYAFLRENVKFDLKLFLGIINSKAFNYYFNYFSFTNHLTVDELERVPVPEISLFEQRSIIAIVDRILAAKHANPSADTTTLESQIDKKVYLLYNLIQEEIKIVELKQ